MKKYIFKGLLYLCVPAAILGSCKKLDVTAGVEQIVSSSFSKTSASFQFLDAKTGRQLDTQGNEDIQIIVSGKNASDVVDNLGSSNIAAGAGILAITLKEGVIPSTSNYVEFSIHASAKGYLPTDQKVVLTSEGHIDFTVYMINISDAPTGISIEQGTISAVPASGVTATAFTLSPTAVSSTGTTASVTIPSGTKLMDKNNAAISGNVTTTLAYFNPEDENTAIALKGTANMAKTTTNEYVTFKDFGIISMEMVSANGKEVKNFGSAIEMTMSIPDGSTNLDGTAVSAGSTVEAYSYNEVTGLWKKESDVTVELNSTTGKLEATFAMNHLCYWKIVDARTYYPSIRFLKIAPLCIEPMNCRVEIFSISQLTMDVILASSSLSQNLLADPLLDMTYRITPIVSSPSSDQGTLTSNTVVNISGNSCPGKSFQIKLVTSCSSKPNRKILPQCYIMAIKEGQSADEPYIKVGQMTDGILETNVDVLEVGQKYMLVTWYKDQPINIAGGLGNEYGTVTITGNNIDLSRPLTNDECDYLKKIVG